MSYEQIYKEKLKTAEEAVKIIKSGDWVDYSQCCAFPTALDNALALRKHELQDVKIRNAISMKPVATVECDPSNEAFTYNLWHCSGIDRKYLDAGIAFHTPMIFRHCGSYYTKGYAPVDVAMITVSPMDENGNFSFGLSHCCSSELLSVAKNIILEVNPNMPYTLGLEKSHINIEDVTYVVESTEEVSTVSSPVATDIDRKIAENIFPYLYNGITLQLGIGGMPNSLGSLIAESDLKDLGMHTELMSDGYLNLYKAGKITNAKKEIHKNKGIFSICNGSRELYDFLDHNEEVLTAPMKYVNDPATIKQMDNFISINGCISADIYGQVCSESSGTRQISGTGGQLDFVTGAFESKNGKAFLAMSSTYKDKEGNVHSRILPKFTQGDIITTPRTQAPYMVTEYGVANLTGQPTWQRAESMISLAHPDFRDELIKEAEKQKIWRRSNKK